MGLLDILRGFDDFGKWYSDQVYYGDEGLGFSIASGSCAGGYEDPIQAFETSVGVGRMPAPENALGMRDALSPAQTTPDSSVHARRDTLRYAETVKSQAPSLRQLPTPDAAALAYGLDG